MSTVKIDYDSSTTFTLALASLASGSAKESAAIDNTSNLYDDIMIAVNVSVPSGTPGADQAIYIYASASEDGTNFTDNASGSAGSISLRTPTNLKLIGVISCPTASVTYNSGPLFLAQAFGGTLPRKMTIVLLNSTNITLDSTEGNHHKSFTGVWYTVA